jgi:hypothetical protein
MENIDEEAPIPVEHPIRVTILENIDEKKPVTSRDEKIPVTFARPKMSRTMSVKLGPNLTARRTIAGHLDHTTGVIAHKQQVIELLGERLPPEPPEPKWSWRKCSIHYSSRKEDDGQQHYRIRSLPAAASSKNPFVLLVKPMQYTNWIADYFRWSFRMDFSIVALTIFAAYLTLILFFSVLIYWSAILKSKCINGNGNGERFMDSFHLSWTTLSTVGYGQTNPQRECSETFECAPVEVPGSPFLCFPLSASWFGRCVPWC